MIKKLINDLVYENIPLSKGLFIGKLIATKIENDSFKNWLNKELNGYEFNDVLIPENRKIFSEMYFLVELPNGSTQKVYLQKHLVQENEKAQEMLKNQRILESIPVIESTVDKIVSKNDNMITAFMPAGMINAAMSALPSETLKKIKLYGAAIRSLQRDYSAENYLNILNQTKSTYLDLLQDLDKQFPNLENDFIMNKDNSKIADSIINNYITGSNNSVNTASGSNITQSNVQNINEVDRNKLKSLGIDDTKISELEIIVQDTNNDSRGSKIMNWLSSVTASVVASGVTNALPQVIDYLQTLNN